MVLPSNVSQCPATVDLYGNRGLDSRRGMVTIFECIFKDNYYWYHRRIQGGAKGACTPHGSEAKTVKSACFGLIFI